MTDVKHYISVLIHVLNLIDASDMINTGWSGVVEHACIVVFTLPLRDPEWQQERNDDLE